MHVRFSPPVDRQTARRFRAWQSFVGDLFHGLRAHGDLANPAFGVRLDLRAHHGVRVGRIGGSAHVVSRTERGGDEIDDVGLLVQTRGRSRLDLDGQSLILEAGQATLFDHARPYRFDLADGFEHRLLLIHRDSLGAARASIEACRGQVLPASALPTRLLMQGLVSLTECEDREWVEPAFATLPLALVDWLGCACEASTADTAVVDRAQRLLKGVQADARRQLVDPELSPASLAASHGMAERTLHKLFASQGLTVMGWVREQRLLAVDRSLRRARAGDKVEAIARDHGFNDPAAFRRVYRRRFGNSPGAVRPMGAFRTDSAGVPSAP